MNTTSKNAASCNEWVFAILKAWGRLRLLRRRQIFSQSCQSVALVRWCCPLFSVKSVCVMLSWSNPEQLYFAHRKPSENILYFGVREENKFKDHFRTITTNNEQIDTTSKSQEFFLPAVDTTLRNCLSNMYRHNEWFITTEDENRNSDAKVLDATDFTWIPFSHRHLGSGRFCLQMNLSRALHRNETSIGLCRQWRRFCPF